MNDISEKLTKFLEDPESVRMLTEIAGNIIGKSDSYAENESKNIPEKVITEDESESENGNAKYINAFSSIGEIFAGADIDNTVRLLTALKPYMSHKRSESTEYVLGLLRILKIAGNNNFTQMMSLIGSSGK